MSSDSSEAFLPPFSMVIILQLVDMCMRPIRNHIIVVPKWAVPNRNHMNDVVEVNRLAPQCYQALSSKRKSLSTGYTLWGFLPNNLFLKVDGLHTCYHYVLSFTPTKVYCNPQCIVSGYKNTSRQVNVKKVRICMYKNECWGHKDTTT